MRERPRPCLGWAQAVGDVFLRLAFDVKCQLLVELALDAARRHQRADAQERITEIHTAMAVTTRRVMMSSNDTTAGWCRLSTPRCEENVLDTLQSDLSGSCCGWCLSQGLCLRAPRGSTFGRAFWSPLRCHSFPDDPDLRRRKNAERRNACRTAATSRGPRAHHEYSFSLQHDRRSNAQSANSRTYAAARDVVPRTMTQAVSVAGSVAVTPNSSPVNNLVPAKAPSNPAVMPAAANVSPRRRPSTQPADGLRRARREGRFPCAPVHGVRHDAVDTHNGERQGEKRKPGEQKGRESRLCGESVRNASIAGTRDTG